MRIPLLAMTLLLPLLAQAQSGAPAQPQTPPNEQVIEPQVPRRDVRVPKIPSNDFIVGVFAGSYATQNFGTSAVFGGRLGYHITEDFMVEAAYARTTVSDESFRQILPGGVFPQPEETLTYYNLSVGVNVLPSEGFFGHRYARPAALYLMAGVGSTKFIDQRKQTVNFGLGYRVFIRDWFGLQVDVRDHFYSLDILGRREDTQNIEFTAGVTFFF